MKQLLLIALALCAFSVPAIIEAKGLDAQAQCVTAIHFVVTDVAANIAPAFVVIERDGYPDESVPLERVTGNMAHYTTTNLLGVPMRRAWAYRPPLWSGQFNLSCAATAVTVATFTAASESSLMVIALIFAALVLFAIYALRKVGM